MAKQLKDILNGVKASKIVPGSTGKDPGVDYAPKAPNEQEFVKLHKTQKHADRVGNGADIDQATNVKFSLEKETKHGYKKPQDENVNEEKECNSSPKGTYCPVHEDDDCSKQMKKSLKEVLTKKTSAGEIISDFQKSKDPKFAGKSAEERKRMALGAYYGMHPEKSKKTNEEVDLEEANVIRNLARKVKIAVRKINPNRKTAIQFKGDLNRAAQGKPTKQQADFKKALVGEESKWSKKRAKAEQTAPKEGGIDMTGAPRNTYADYSVDVNTGRNV